MTAGALALPDDVNHRRPIRPAVAVDYDVGDRQNRVLEGRAALKKKLERLAWG
ncbi:MAG TPA: hypothetical protein VFG09_10375 [Thermodesulfovibrionales bacterium]|nr:hypothetical protein [Thermodesulfovibrionales bacterium]